MHSIRSTLGLKKTTNIVLVLLLTLILSSCFTSNEDVNNAKKELGIIELDETNNDSGTNIGLETGTGNQDITQEDENPTDEIKQIEIKPLTDDQFLEFDDLTGENLLDGEIEITGKTLTNVDKIIVNFANETSDFPVDNYRLQQFASGDDTFLYRAFSRYETLDFGKNLYIFEAYSGDKISKIELVINIPKEEEKEIEDKVEESFDDISLDSLPIKSNFGTPIDLGDGKVSYSDIQGLEIKRDTDLTLTCENLTSELVDVIDGWFFWNTCRPIATDEGISFFVIRLDGDKYVYEKHYYLSYKGIHGIQELETGTGIDQENIDEKNAELKEKNTEFPILPITDDLFNEILK